MKKLVFVVGWLISALAMFGASYGWVKLDLWINPWLTESSLEGLQMWTSLHGPALLYIRDSVKAFLLLGGISFILGGVLAGMLAKPLSELLE